MAKAAEYADVQNSEQKWATDVLVELINSWRLCTAFKAKYVGNQKLGRRGSSSLFTPNLVEIWREYES